MREIIFDVFTERYTRWLAPILVFALVGGAHAETSQRASDPVLTLARDYHTEVSRTLFRIPVSNTLIRMRVNAAYRIKDKPFALANCTELLFNDVTAGEMVTEGANHLAVINHLTENVQRRFPPISITRFHARPMGAQRSFIREVVERAGEVNRLFTQMTDDPDVLEQVNVDIFLSDLLGIPFAETQERLLRSASAAEWRAHWSGTVADARLNSSAHQMLQLQNVLGPLSGQMVDLGSGFGVPGFLLTLMNPRLSYLGLELVPPKIEAARIVAKRLGLKRVHFAPADFSRSDFVLPQAKYYFMYNPAEGDILKRVFDQLDRLPAEQSPILIYTGRPTDDPKRSEPKTFYRWRNWREVEYPDSEIVIYRRNPAR